MNSGGNAVPRKGSAEKPQGIPHTRIPDDSMIKDNYEVGSKIGQGNFGKVYEATHKTTGIKWAIKSINKEKAGSSALKLVEREVTILKRVNHPNIIALNEVVESPKRMYLVLELCKGGELADILKANNTLTEDETKIVIQRLAGAISYLHRFGIVHRDLKLENILIGKNQEDPTDKLHVKVTDFGLSVVKGGVTPDNMMQDFCGTPIYMAPEILDNKAYSQQCDVWALGIIMYTLLCGYPPFRAKDEAALYDMIREANVEFTDDVWRRISDPCKKCIQGMLKLDPAHRLSAAEVLNHPWITGQERDTNEPANVLEMMKLWKDELKQDNMDAVGCPSEKCSDDEADENISPLNEGHRNSVETGKSTVDATIKSKTSVNKVDAKVSQHAPSTSTKTTKKSSATLAVGSGASRLSVRSTTPNLKPDKSSTNCSSPANSTSKGSLPSKTKKKSQTGN